MSKDGSSGESGAQDSGDNAGDVKDVNASIYENKGPKKIVRIITVLAYMFSVSFVAIVLSAYYVFLWEPPNPRLMHSPAIRLQADPRLDFLRIESPPEQYLNTISQHLSSKKNNSYERIQEQVEESTLGNNDLEEFVTTLKTTLAEELIHEKNNDNDSSSSSIQEYLVKHNRNNADNNVKENTKINSLWKNLRQNYNLKQTIVIDRGGERKNEMNETIFINKIMYNNLMEDSEQKNEEEENKEKKTQIEKTTTAKSITTNETMDETSEMPTTLREKNLLQILTETTKTKEILPNVSFSSVASKEPLMIDVVTTTKSYKEDKSRN